jgi:hypothetical protein
MRKTNIYKKKEIFWQFLWAKRIFISSGIMEKGIFMSEANILWVMGKSENGVIIIFY